jgi:hypothetical protein
VKTTFCVNRRARPAGVPRGQAPPDSALFGTRAPGRRRGQPGAEEARRARGTSGRISIDCPTKASVTRAGPRKPPRARARPKPAEAEREEEGDAAQDPHRAARGQHEGHRPIGIVLDPEVREERRQGEPQPRRVVLEVVAVGPQAVSEAPASVQVLELVGVERPTRGRASAEPAPARRAEAGGRAAEPPGRRGHWRHLADRRRSARRRPRGPTAGVVARERARWRVPGRSGGAPSPPGQATSARPCCRPRSGAGTAAAGAGWGRG